MSERESNKMESAEIPAKLLRQLMPDVGVREIGSEQVHVGGNVVVDRHCGASYLAGRYL